LIGFIGKAINDIKIIFDLKFCARVANAYINDKILSRTHNPSLNIKIDTKLSIVSISF